MFERQPKNVSLVSVIKWDFLKKIWNTVIVLSNENENERGTSWKCRAGGCLKTAELFRCWHPQKSTIMTFQICWSTSYSSRLPFFFSSSKAFAKCWFHLDFKYFSSSPFYSSFLSFHSQFAFRFPSNISNLHKLLCLCGFTFNSLKIQHNFLAFKDVKHCSKSQFFGLKNHHMKRIIKITF